MAENETTKRLRELNESQRSHIVGLMKEVSDARDALDKVLFTIHQKDHIGIEIKADITGDILSQPDLIMIQDVLAKMKRAKLEARVQRYKNQVWSFPNLMSHLEEEVIELGHMAKEGNLPGALAEVADISNMADALALYIHRAQVTEYIANHPELVSDNPEARL